MLRAVRSQHEAAEACLATLPDLEQALVGIRDSAAALLASFPDENAAAAGQLGESVGRFLALVYEAPGRLT